LGGEEKKAASRKRKKRKPYPKGAIFFTGRELVSHKNTILRLKKEKKG